MTAPSVERCLGLNTAQLRNLRNWNEAERPLRTMHVLVRPSRPTTSAEVRNAVRALVSRHEALRSRLAHNRDGELVQEVLAADHVDVPFTEVEPPPATPAPESVPPDERACQVTLHLNGGRVELVVVWVSHVFTDAFGLGALGRDLARLLAGVPFPPGLPRQASQYADGPKEPRVLENTEFWKELLTNAPRSCTYSGVEREEYEKVETAHVPLSPAQDERIISACRALRMTRYALWATAVSVLVSRICGQHRQVVRSTYANRFLPADLRVIAQLAQAVFVPIEGTSTDTLRTRSDALARTALATVSRGIYDANALLDWLNEPRGGAAVMFQPTFELNYVPAPNDAMPPALPESDRVEVTEARINPPSAKADLAITVSHLPGSVLRLSARRPVSRQRGARDLAADCLAVVELLCTNPEMPICEVPVDPLPATAGLLGGHHTGVAVDLAMTKRFVTSVPGIVACDVEARDGGTRLHARVAVREPIRPAALRRELRDRQPWFSGTVVPDEILITQTSG